MVDPNLVTEDEMSETMALMMQDFDAGDQGIKKEEVERPFRVTRKTPQKRPHEEISETADSDILVEEDSPQSINSASSTSGRTSQSSKESGASRRRKKKIAVSYSCDDCEMTWPRPSERDKHWRIVHGPKNHKCQVCGKGFAYAKDVTRHMSVHKTETPGLDQSEERNFDADFSMD